MSMMQFENYDAERNRTITVKYSDIPSYLKESEFYKSLSDEDPEGVIGIPVQCFHQETTIETDYDFYCHLHAFLFWGFETIPTHVLDYCSRIDYVEWERTAKDVLSKELFALLGKAFIEKTENPYNRNSNVRLIDLPLYLLPYWMTHHPPQIRGDRRAIFTTEAAMDGALDVLKFQHMHGYRFDTHTCTAAAEGGHLECLKFLHESGCPWDEHTCESAAENGHFDCLKYAHEKGCPWNDAVTMHLCMKAVDLDIEWLRYVLERVCPIYEHACVEVIAANRFDYLQLLQLYNAPWSTDTMKLSVEKNNLQYIQYLYEYGCPWDENVVVAATTVDMFSFLLARSCPCPEYLLVISAMWRPQRITSNDRCACLQYLIEVQVQGMYLHEDGTLFQQAMLCADLLCVQYLVDQGCPWGTTQFSVDMFNIDKTYDARLLPCLQYAVEHGWKYDRSIINCMCELRLLKCMKYFVDQQHITWSITREATVGEDNPPYYYYKPAFTYTAVFDE